MSAFVTICLIYLDSHYILVADDGFALRKAFFNLSPTSVLWFRSTDKMMYDQLLG
jgi:hypothetical protein